MQYKVPQNIDIEDQVIGPLTLRQFLYLLVGAGILVVIKFSLVGGMSFLFLPIAVLVGGFFLALAFFRPGERPFEVFLMSIITSFTRPKKRIWQKEPFKVQKEVKIQKEEKETLKKISNEDLEKLAFLVDSGGFEEELKGKGYISAMQPSMKLTQTEELNDSISPSEKSSEELKDMLKVAKEKVKKVKTEPTIQEIASINPAQNFKYETIMNDSKFIKNYEDILKMAQKRQEERFEEARITK